MSSARVLLVGDDDALPRLDDAFDVERVASVDAAVDRVTAGHVDCVVGLGEPSTAVGDDLASALHDHTDAPPVVFAGDESLETVAADVLSNGVAAYVCLDSESADLIEVLEGTIAGSRTRRDRSRISPDLPGAGCVVRSGTISAAARELVGLVGVDDLAGRPIGELAAEDDRDAVSAAVDGLDPGEQDSVRFSPAGVADRTVEARLRRSEVDDAVVASVFDVTEAAEREAALEEESDMFESLLANVPMSIYFKDRLGRHVRVSDFQTRNDPEDYLMNWEGKIHPHPHDIIGKTDFDLYAPDFAEETVADDRRVMEAEEPIVNLIEAGTDSLGGDFYTSTTKVPRYDDEGNVVGLVGISIDVTQRIEHRHELERQNQRLNEFAEVLTHDLRNPLNIAQGYLDHLEDGYDPDAVGEASDALSRIEGLIEEIRSFVIEGRTVEDPEVVELETAAAEAWSTVDTGEAELDLDGSLSFRADPERLRRLLENLFGNAIDHGSEDDSPRGRDITVRVESLENGFAVEDDGVGISPDAVDQVFERGFTTSRDGTGFGLAIVRNIAEAHGWSIDVEQGDDGGARFVVTNLVLAGDVMGRTLSN